MSGSRGLVEFRCGPPIWAGYRCRRGEPVRTDRSHGFAPSGRNCCRGPDRSVFEVVHGEAGYLGADKDAGPNYTGQPAVHSYYELATG
jgi:hypothetical protein